MSEKTFPRTFPSDGIEATAATSPRRTTHSASGWTLPSGLQSLRQPQDGSLTNSGSVTAGIVRPINGNLDSRSSNPFVEAEDARLNGSLRSLARRVKGLNVMARPAAPQTDRYAVETILRKNPETSRKALAGRPQVA